MARILLVDDEQDIREMFAQALTNLGHSVDVAATAGEAMELASKKDFDLAIIDYVLPGKRGLELLHDLRKSRPFLRSIMISGQIDHDVFDAADLERQLRERIAADRYLAKPARIEDLKSAIEDVMAPTKTGDWQKLAADAVATQSVRPKEVKEMDRAMRKARKRPGK